MVPDEDDAEMVIRFVQRILPAVKERDAVKKAINKYGLTDDELKALIAYKLETPYPVYKWLNGHLGSQSRNLEFGDAIGPYFTLLYRAMEKLPKVTTKGARSVLVRNIPALEHTFNNYSETLAAGKNINFWSFSSFSSDDAVINNKAFIGGLDDKAIIYTCPELTGVDMEPFAGPNTVAEAEILPLAPQCSKLSLPPRLVTN